MEGTIIKSKLAFSPDAKVLATIVNDDVRLREVRTGMILFDLRGSLTDPNDIAFSPDGQTLAVGGNDEIQLWNTRTGQLRSSLKEDDLGKIWQMIYTPDGKTLVFAADGLVRVWNPASDKQSTSLYEKPRNIPRLAMPSDGHTLAISTEESHDDRDFVKIEIWDLKKRMITATWNDDDAERHPFVFFQPDGKVLLSVTWFSPTSGIRRWDVRTRKAIGVPVKFHANGLPTAIAPDGKSFVLEDRDTDNLSLRDVVTGNLIAELPGHEIFIQSVAFSKDGRTLATSDGDGVTKIWAVRQPLTK
ncbi:WD-40 repeat protein [Fimbriiglobus ruber]|uniref:WD-40 repeat protein n=1 Tax=Fimbriiglobus ruber TaxID=1908690 RepID=A0A225E0N6_9BACT|nr:WD-40 repeat protein [Fimbriiglobus ruber]